MALADEDLSTQVVALAGAFERLEIPYAVGGALAYAFHAEPRATVDIDIDIFLPETNASGVFDLLAEMGLDFPSESGAIVVRDGQIRLTWGKRFVDLFFAILPFYSSCAQRTVRVPFGGTWIQVLSAEDLVVFKVLFNRGKDWLDIEQVLRTQGSKFDVAYALTWLAEMVGTEDSARQRFAALVAELRLA